MKETVLEVFGKVRTLCVFLTIFLFGILFITDFYLGEGSDLRKSFPENFIHHVDSLNR